MEKHTKELFQVVKPGGRIHYIVGNSKFYDVMLPVESIFAALFEATGFVKTEVKTIRKRTSKKELFEFVVSAGKPLIA
jgi:predicted methyltransferase